MEPSPLVLLHIGAGLLALLAGAAALSFRKGSRWHRATGNAFFLSMLVMSAMGAYRALLQPNATNVTMGVFTFYLVSTAWMTVIRKEGTSGRFEVGAMLVGFAVAAGAAIFGFQAVSSDTGAKDGMPAEFYFVVAGIATLVALADVRLIVRGGISGARRIARHLWRMCFALFIAAGSFFLGQPLVWPEPLRGSAVLIAPVLLVIVAMVFWLCRVLIFSRRRKSTGQVPWTIQDPRPTRS